MAEASGWDKELLQLELGELIDLDVEIALTGFELGEIDVILDGSAPAKVKADPADALPELAEVAVTRRGDIWLMGKHRLMCGDARDPGDYARLLDGEKAQAVFTDPPYNLPASKIGGLGKTQHREFAMAVGEMSKEAFTAFLREVFGQIAANVQDGGPTSSISASSSRVCWRVMVSRSPAALPSSSSAAASPNAAFSVIRCRSVNVDPIAWIAFFSPL